MADTPAAPPPNGTVLKTREIALTGALWLAICGLIGIAICSYFVWPQYEPAVTHAITVLSGVISGIIVGKYALAVPKNGGIGGG